MYLHCCNSVLDFKDELDVAVSFVTLVTLIFAFAIGYWRFVWKRERFTFVRMIVKAKTVREINGLILIAITVRLENKGDTRVRARTRRDSDGYLYNKAPDSCRHAGTLKIRPIPHEEKNPLLFDWYSLPQLEINSRLVPEVTLVESTIDLEQINYLDEFQYPDKRHKETDFWLEPRETYDQLVPLWLKPGSYAAKAIFLGPKTKGREEEYWSCHYLFSVGDS